MNVLEILSSAGVNGAIYHCLLLSRELARRGHRVTLVCRRDAWIARQLESDPVEVIDSDLHRWPPDELRRIAAAARERRIEVIHTHLSRAHFFGVLLRWRSGIPCVATAQSRHVQLHWMFNDRVIAVSDATRRYHRTYNLVRGRRIVTIHNFIDYDRAADVAGDAGPKFRASIGVDASALLVGVVGNVCRRKGHIHLVRAMPRIVVAEPNARLVIVGDYPEGDYLAQVRAAAKELGVASRIAWTGHRHDVHRILPALDLAVLPSNEESLPLGVLEAMAAGVPVVATNVGGIPECVLSGETGTLVPPADVDALARAVILLLRDPNLRRRYGEAGRRRVREHFSPQSQTPQIEAVFASVAGRARAA
jgi:glycosyltransferase involved in cell wall biosynthesis